MRELDLLPTWYVQLGQERRRLRRTAVAAALVVCAAIALQAGAWWALARQRDRLTRLDEQSARLTAAASRRQTLARQRDGLLAEYQAWEHAAAPVSAVDLSRKLAALVPAHVTLTTLRLDAAARAVRLSGVAGDDVDVAALLLSLNRERSFDGVMLGAVKDQRLLGQTVRRFDLSFVAAADTQEAAP